MADLSVTAASVKAGANSAITNGTAGATITAGELVYKNSSDKFVLSDNDAAGAKTVTGVALNGAADGQPLSVQTGGDITIGATMTAGLTYYLSATAGGIAPYADLITGDDVVLVGIAVSTTTLRLGIVNTGVTL